MSDSGTARVLTLAVLFLLGASFLTQSRAEVTTQTYNLAVGVGQVGQVRLPVNPSTGCSWWVESAPSTVDISTSSDIDPTVDCGNPPRPGCSNEIVVYSFRSNAAGDYTIELRYGHAWARNEYYQIAVVHLIVAANMSATSTNTLTTPPRTTSTLESAITGTSSAQTPTGVFAAEILATLASVLLVLAVAGVYYLWKRRK